MATRYWEDAVHGQLPGAIVFHLIFLRIIIALEVLLPTTLYLSIVIALGRLYRDAEITAMFACGISMTRIIRSVLLVSIITCGVVACLSLYTRPWAWNQFFWLKAEAKASFDLKRMKGGNFYKTDDGKRIIFADRVDNQNNQAKGIFIQTKKKDSLQIIYAEKATQFDDETSGEPIIVFQEGQLYEFPRDGEKGLILQFENSAMHLEPKEIIRPDYKVKTISTKKLLRSKNLEEIAELQWRLSSPLSTILLSLLAIFLSRASPRQGKYANAPIAIIIFAVYYNFSAIMKKWVSQGFIETVPGIWWGQMLLVSLLIFLLWQPTFFQNWRKR
jgi:lipopolysaccharide export system permease protein